MRSPLLRLPEAIHTAVFSPTGGGKGVSVIIPHLLSNPESMVVIDFKGDLAVATREARRWMGHHCVFLDPFRLTTTTPDSLNVLDFVPKGDAELLDTCRDIAEALVVRTGQEMEPHWNDSAQFGIHAVCAFVAQCGPPDDRSLQTVRDIIGNPALLKHAIAGLQASADYDGLLARMGHQLTHYQDKELASTLTTTNRFLSFLDSPAVQITTDSSTFDPADLKRDKMTVYLILPPHHLRAQSALLRLWISSLLRAVVRQGLGGNRVWFVLDEAASLGHLECLDDMIDKYRGYGIRSILAYQSMGQLQQCWPEGKAQTLLSNTTQIFFGVNDPTTAEYVSKRLGEQTLAIASGGSSYSRSRTIHPFFTGNQPHCDSVNVSRSSNDNWSQAPRALLKPDEVMQLHPRLAIVFAAGMRPALVRLVRFFEEPHLFRQNRFRGFLASGKALVRALVFMVLGLTCAGAMTLFALAEEKRRERPVVGGTGWQATGAKPATGAKAGGKVVPPKAGGRHRP
jgi:type IV secretion system protein VirD4